MVGVKSSDLVFGGSIGTSYASPFNDISMKYLPKTQADLFRWCQYYLDNSPIIQQAIRRMSSYPITKITPLLEDPINQEKATDVLTILKVRDLCQSIAMQYFAFGNSFATVVAPYERQYRCEACKASFILKSAEIVHASSKERGRLFRLRRDGKLHRLAVSVCPLCKTRNTFIKIIDKPKKNIEETKVILMHPLNIRIDKNPVSGKCEYRFVMAESMRNKIRGGDKFLIETSPKIFVDAAIFGKDIVLNNSSIYHFNRLTADTVSGWGHPIIQGVLRELLHGQIIKKAAEALAVQHINPLMLISPQDSGQANIYQHLDLSNWSTNMENQIKKWRKDPNHIPIMPVPTNVDYIGGQYKGLDPTASSNANNEEIAMGMGVPKEFLLGGTSFSSSSIALRMLENDFGNLRTMLTEFINKFLIPTLTRTSDINAFEVKFSNLRTADDVQQKDLMMRLMEMNKLSTETMLNECGFDYKKETERIYKEMKQQIDKQQEVQGEEMGAPMMYNVEIPLNGKTGLGMTSQEEMVGFLGSMMSQSPPEAQEFYSAMMKEQAPNIYEAVSKQMAKGEESGSSAQGTGGGSSKDKKPLPNQKPPRRTNSPV